MRRFRLDALVTGLILALGAAGFVGSVLQGLYNLGLSHRPAAIQLRGMQ